MLISHARKPPKAAMEYVSPANSSNLKWLTNKHPSTDPDYYDDNDDEDRKYYYYSGYRSIAKHTSSRFLRGSSFANCNAWSFGCPSPMDSCPTTPSPVCSPVSSSPPSHFNQASTDEIGQELIEQIKKEGLSNKRNEDEKSLATSNYYADDDRLLQAVFQVPEDDTFSSVSSTGGYRECETSDIESAFEDRLESRRKSKFAAWKQDRKMEIMNKLIREEAAIDDWEKKTTAKAKMVMREIEVKLENMRERAMQNMQRKIISAQNEAKKNKFRKRAAASKKIEEVIKKSTASTGNWIHSVLKTC